MSLKDLGDFIAQVGFPTFVAVVLLFQVLHMHKENHDQMGQLANEIKELLVTLRLTRSSQGDKGNGK